MNNQQTDCERDTTPQALLSIDEALELLWYIYLFCFKINGVTIHSGIVKTRDKNISIQINS
jgi:hypothetical protein